MGCTSSSRVLRYRQRTSVPATVFVRKANPAGTRVGANGFAAGTSSTTDSEGTIRRLCGHSRPRMPSVNSGRSSSSFCLTRPVRKAKAS